MTILLDGGMGGELMKRGWDSPNIWSARALIEAPHVVRDLHREFIDAGATVITTSNYSCTPKILAREGHGHRVAELVGRARDVANEARAKHAHVKVAGSLPPSSAPTTPNSSSRRRRCARSMTRSPARWPRASTRSSARA